MSPAGAGSATTIAIGRVAVGIRTSDAAFRSILENRYAGFLAAGTAADCEFDVELAGLDDSAADEDVRVYRSGNQWHMARGDFRAEWDPAARRGRIRQSASPYALDSMLRIVHTLVLAREGGFLVHAASAVRNGRAFLFAGPSGAGKTTMARLAPDDVAVLTDEVSYVRKEEDGYYAYGTPFAGDLARAGHNTRAPLAALCLLVQGRGNRLEDVRGADAVRGVLSNVLFFAEDPELVREVFRSVVAFVERVPVRSLEFLPDQRAWELIQ